MFILDLVIFIRKDKNMKEYDFYKDPYRNDENIFNIYQNISTNGFLKILFCYKSDIKKFNYYVRQYLTNNKNINISDETETIYCEKINSLYFEKQKSFISTLLNSLMIFATFMLVIISYCALTKQTP